MRQCRQATAGRSARSSEPGPTHADATPLEPAGLSFARAREVSCRCFKLQALIPLIVPRSAPFRAPLDPVALPRLAPLVSLGARSSPAIHHAPRRARCGMSLARRACLSASNPARPSLLLRCRTGQHAPSRDLSRRWLRTTLASQPHHPSSVGFRWLPVCPLMDGKCQLTKPGRSPPLGPRLCGTGSEAPIGLRVEDYES
jgi:hypothetical protein